MDLPSISLTNISLKKRRIYMIVLLIVVLAGIAFIVWYYFLPEDQSLTFEPIRPKKIEIDFDVLDGPSLDELQLYDIISPLEGDFGRENPFIPY